MQTLSDKISDSILKMTEELFTTISSDESELNDKVNGLCFSIEYFAAFCATTARKLAEKEGNIEVSNISLDFMLEAVLDKRAAEFGAKVSGDPDEGNQETSAAAQ